MTHPDTLSVQLRINGEALRAEVSPRRRLVDLLRRDLGRTDTKEGCGCGECGACTVLLDGRPVNSCVVPAVEADGCEVITAEGLGAERLHLVQRAFVATGAVQCGYCTPGMVLAAASLLERDTDPDEGTIREALAGNVCRCSGYAQIVAAVRMAASGDIPELESHRVGNRAPREDAEAKVTGQTRYTDDLPHPDGLLHASVVRSTEAHALVTGIETEAARAVPGVVAVLTHRDVPGEALFGNAIHDQPVLASDRVRFLGEAIALVVAETRAAAAEGRDRVQVSYDRLPAVTAAAAALTRGSERVHPDREDGNLMGQLQLRRGDVDAAMADAHQVVERTYRTSWQEHACLEPEVAQAEHDDEGGIVVRCPSQNVFFDRLHVHKALDLERAQVRVIQQPTGAAFGGREDIYAQTHAALAALHTGRPVRLLWSREESQIATTKRHPMTMVYRAGLDEGGRIVALDVDALADTGAYASWGPNIARKTLVHAAGPFAVGNQRVRVRMAYTNNGISGAFRGFGATQVTYGYGVFARELARACELDHLEFLRRNHLQPGQITATGQQVRGDGLARCLERALASAGAPPSTDEASTIRRGRGICTFLYGIGYGNAIPDIGSAVVELADDGHIQVRCGAVDYGQGARTVFLQVVCDLLGIEAAQVEIITGDTHLTPDSGSTVASRQTTVSGSAVAKAAQIFGEAMVKAAAGLVHRDASDLVTGPEGIVDADDGDVLITWAELSRGLDDAGVRRAKQARYRLRSTRLDLDTGQGDAYGTYAFGCQIADVSVDTTTGAVSVDRIHAAHDVGRAINPAMVEGQIVGGTVMGLGFALTEHHRIDGGVPVTWNFDTYRLPAATDAPDVIPLIVEEPDEAGPYGARGIGEPAMVATAPAIANAVADAVGATVRELPMTPERVWRAMKSES